MDVVKGLFDRVLPAPEGVSPPGASPRKVSDKVPLPSSDRWFAGLIAAVAVAFPPFVVWGDLTGPADCVHGSLSAYYYASTRDFFVGGLAALGFFLIAFHGVLSWRRVESWMTTLAGIAVIAVALFPTAPEVAGKARCPTPIPGGAGTTKSVFQRLVGLDGSERVHYVVAVGFVVLLLILALYFARWAEGALRVGHLVAGCVIAVAALYMLLLNLVEIDLFRDAWYGRDHSLLVGEWVSVWAFSASWWLRLGEPKRKVPADSSSAGNGET